MTHPALLTLQGVSFRLADGSLLFTKLDAHFDSRPTALVGRNGVGKSVLARMLAGQLSPTEGRVLRHGTVFYLPQQMTPRPGETVASLAGMHTALDALRRIERGSTQPRDFDLVGERWDIREQLAQMLHAIGLAHLDAQVPATRLSGGELTRVALAGALLSGADMLILDEPSNHLDRGSRQYLRDQLRQWRGGLIVVSHDRELLEAMPRIVELSDLGLRSYGGNHDAYVKARARERAAAEQHLERLRTERKRESRVLDRQRERADRRLARGARAAAAANLPKIVLGLRRSRSQASAGKRGVRHDAAREALSRRVHDAAAQVESHREAVLFAPPPGPTAPARIAVLSGVALPYVERTTCIDLTLTRGQRLAIVGPNGCGKSTLLKLLAGRAAPVRGRCDVAVDAVCIDQHLSILEPDVSVLEQLIAVNAAGDEGTLRTRLALIGLDATQVERPFGRLSGGERVRAAIARALYADRPAQLLLLDEPSNHLDLAATEALEDMLRQFTGTLVVVSHDPRFLARIGLTHRMDLQVQPSRPLPLCGSG